MASEKYLKYLNYLKLPETAFIKSFAAGRNRWHAYPPC